MRHGHQSTKKAKETGEHRSKYISNVAKEKYYVLAEQVKNSEFAIDNSSFYNAYLTNFSNFNENPNWNDYDKMNGLLNAAVEYKEKKSLESSLN